jgi:hypothetical protein
MQPVMTSHVIGTMLSGPGWSLAGWIGMPARLRAKTAI